MSCGQVKQFTDSLFFLDKDKLFGNRTSKNFVVLAWGTSEIFLKFLPLLYTGDGGMDGGGGGVR